MNRQTGLSVKDTAKNRGRLGLMSGHLIVERLVNDLYVVLISLVE